MQSLGVIQGGNEFPVLPAIAGVYDDAVSAHGPPFPRIAEPHIQKRASRPRRAAGLGVIKSKVSIVQRNKYRLIIRCCSTGLFKSGDLGLGPREHHFADVTAVELLAPSFAAIRGS
ncbi:hypothetical protein D9M70_496270 [compost metagenome]